MSKIGYWRFSFRCWRHETAERLRWKIAYAIPRKLALIVFVRVFSATAEGPDASYEDVYKGWENGAGR